MNERNNARLRDNAIVRVKPPTHVDWKEIIYRSLPLIIYSLDRCICGRQIDRSILLVSIEYSSVAVIINKYQARGCPFTRGNCNPMSVN
jgi:hypothetical protein